MVSYHEHIDTKKDRDMLQVSDAKCFQEAEFVSITGALESPKHTTTRSAWF